MPLIGSPPQHINFVFDTPTVCIVDFELTLTLLPNVTLDSSICSVGDPIADTMVSPFYPKRLGVVLSWDFPASSSAKLIPTHNSCQVLITSKSNGIVIYIHCNPL